MKKVVTTALAMAITVGMFSFDSGAESKVFGKNRTETSIKASDYVDSKTLVLVNGYNFADALSSYNIVASKNAKLILVDDNTDISGLIKKKAIETVYLIGGENTLKGKAVKDAQMLVKNIKRISGNDRYETNRKTLVESGYTRVGVADGRNYPDALSSSGLLKKEKLGIMLVDGSKGYKTDNTVEYTFGGKKSVAQDGGKRLSGKDRYETSRAINRELGTAGNTVFTSGTNFADALSALNFVNKPEGVAIVLTEGTLNDADMITSDNYKEKYGKMPETFIVGGNLKVALNKEKVEEKKLEDSEKASDKSDEKKKLEDSEKTSDKSDEKKEETYKPKYEGKDRKDLEIEFEVKKDLADYYGKMAEGKKKLAYLIVGRDYARAREEMDLYNQYAEEYNKLSNDVYDIGIELGLDMPFPDFK